MMILQNYLFCLIFLIISVSNNIYSQFNTKYEDISNEDLIVALQFAGIDIFKFPLDTIKQNYKFSIIVDEYVKKDSIIFSDTLLSYYTKYRKSPVNVIYEDAYIDNFRFITKVLNNSYDKIYIFSGTNSIDNWRELTIVPKYARKHYWVRFAKQPVIVGQKIPLLFYGSEWDDIIDGKIFTRFCSRIELAKELNDPTIKFIPHFFIISYKLNKLP